MFHHRRKDLTDGARSGSPEVSRSWLLVLLAARRWRPFRARIRGGNSFPGRRCALPWAFLLRLLRSNKSSQGIARLVKRKCRANLPVLFSDVSSVLGLFLHQSSKSNL